MLKYKIVAILSIVVVIVIVLFISDERNRIIFVSSKEMPPDKVILGVRIGMTVDEAVFELKSRGVEGVLLDEGIEACSPFDTRKSDSAYIVYDHSSWRVSGGCMYFRNGRLLNMFYRSGVMDL